jgi:hypothetical protein
MQALAKAARQVAGKEALDVSNTAQLRDICLAAARICGWKGESEVNVAVNNQVGVVISESKAQGIARAPEAAPRTGRERGRALPTKAAPNYLARVTNAVTGPHLSHSPKFF